LGAEIVTTLRSPQLQYNISTFLRTGVPEKSCWVKYSSENVTCLIVKISRYEKQIVLIAGKDPSKTRLGIEAHRYFHLLESRLVLAASFVGRRERMSRRTASGKLLRHLLFPSVSCSSFSVCFFWWFFFFFYK